MARVVGLPVPGPVLGMALLFGLLQWRRPRAGAGVLVVSDVLLAHLQLFFVPAGVGVVLYFGLLRDEAVPLTVALVGSWLVGLVVVGWLLTLWGRRVDG